MIQYIISIFCFLLIQSAESGPFRRGKAIVNINGQVQTLTTSTSCKPKYWQQSQESACMCCVAKRSLRGNTFVHNGRAIKHCLKKGHCTQSVLEKIALKVDRKYTPEDPSFLASAIINHVKAIETVSRFNKAEHAKGKMTTEGARRAIRELAARGLLRGKVGQCLTVEPLHAGGSQTISMFLVKESSLCTHPGEPEQVEGVYIVKQLGRGNKEARRLVKLRNSFFNQYALTNQDRSEDYPAIALDVLSFKYKSVGGKTHFVSVLPLAPGQSVFQTLKNFASVFKAGKSGSPRDKIAVSGQENKIKSVMTRLGTKLARLHKKHMTRKGGRLTGRSHATHGDFHSNNVFVSQDDVIIIDPESFVFSLKKPRPVGMDLTRIYTFSTLRNAKHQNARKGNVGMTDWHKLVIDPFFRAYVRSFSMEDGRFNRENFEDVLKILRRNFSIRGSTNDVAGVFIKVGFIRSMWAYRKYIRRMLGDIETSFKKEFDL